MIERYSQVKRKTLDEDRVAICPHFGCKHIKKVKPLKFGFIGFRKYPKCSRHKLSLVFIDEFVENFINAVNLCIFDESSLPPKSLSKLIAKEAPESLKTFVNGWIYCNPVGRGAQIVSHYMNGLSKSYMKLLSGKQKKALNDVDKSKKYRELHQGLEKIAKEYSDFLQNLREKSESFYKVEFLNPFTNEVRNLIHNWLKCYLNEIRDLKHKDQSSPQNKSLSQIKHYYDKFLHAGTCALLLGESPALVTKDINSFELFSSYHEFSQVGLCKQLSIDEIHKYLEQLSYTKIKPAVNNLAKDQLSEEIINFINLNKNLEKNFNIQINNEEFVLNWIKEIFLFLKNNTGQLNSIDLFKLQVLPMKIYTLLDNLYSGSKNFPRNAEFLKKIKKLYGLIYLGVNLASKNKKVYVGQTILTIEQEWGEIIQKGTTLRKKRQHHPNQYIPARYIHNAIAKYGPDVWDLKLIDIAFKKLELDLKESYYIVDVYDSINPKKGYNLTTGGRSGGRLSSETKKKVSRSVKEIWKTPGYKERLSKVQLESWQNEERQKKTSLSQLKAWENEERRLKASQRSKQRWTNEEMRKKMEINLSKSAVRRWQDPTEKMLDSLKNMQLSTKKEINDIRGFLIDIRDTKNQIEFFDGDLFKKYGIKSHMTLNRRIKELLGEFGVNNHGEAHRFFYDRSINEVLKFLDNPDGYNIFRDPMTEQFFIDVREAGKSSNLHNKYRVWHKNGLIIKIKRIVGKCGINNYTSLKKILLEKGVDECLEYFATLEQN